MLYAELILCTTGQDARVSKPWLTTLKCLESAIAICLGRYESHLSSLTSSSDVDAGNQKRANGSHTSDAILKLRPLSELTRDGEVKWKLKEQLAFQL